MTQPPPPSFVVSQRNTSPWEPSVDAGPVEWPPTTSENGVSTEKTEVNASLSLGVANAVSDPPRESRILSALRVFTSIPYDFTITPIHYPLAVPNADGSTLGKCSCGGLYQLETTAHGVVVAKVLESSAGLLPPGESWCFNPGKHPVFSGFNKSFDENSEAQARTPDEAAKLWQGRPYNIGVVTGQSHGLVVMDVDARHNGVVSLKQLTTDVLALTNDEWNLEDTFQYMTSPDGDGRPGVHLYFNFNKDDRELWNELVRMKENILPGIEMKFKKGMVVACPSLHGTGAQYSFVPKEQRTHSMIPVKLTRPKVMVLREGIRIAMGKLSVPNGSTFDFSAAASAHYDSGGDADAIVPWRHAKQLPKFQYDDQQIPPGFWMTLFKYWLYTGTPAQTFGPGLHQVSLKGLVGAAVTHMLEYDSDIMQLVEARKHDPQFVPEEIGACLIRMNAAVTADAAGNTGMWAETQNFIGLVQNAMNNELQKYSWAGDH